MSDDFLGVILNIFNKFRNIRFILKIYELKLIHSELTLILSEVKVIIYRLLGEEIRCSKLEGLKREHFLTIKFKTL